MRKLTWLLVVAAALAAAGAAVAHRSENKGINVVSTSFSAKPTSDTKTRSCTDATGHTWTITRAVYTGTATGQLAGTVTIRTESTVDTTAGNGFTRGTLVLRDSSNHRIGTAQLDAVNSQNGALNGMLRGQVSGGMLLANFSAALAGDGSLNGDVGGGSATNSAIVFGGLPRCTTTAVTPPKPVVHADGRITAVSSTSLTVGGDKRSLTVTVPSSLASAVSTLKVGDRVSITAARVNDAYVLVALKARNRA